MNEFASTQNSGLLKSSYEEDQDRPVAGAVKKRKKKMREKLLDQMDQSDERGKGEE